MVVGQKYQLTCPCDQLWCKSIVTIVEDRGFGSFVIDLKDEEGDNRFVGRLMSKERICSSCEKSGCVTLTQE